MQYYKLGRSNLRVSKVALGTGGRSQFGQKKHGNEDAPQPLVKRALDLGINLFDTSPAYGESEQMLGSALRELDATDDVVIASKVLPTQPSADSLSSATPKNAEQITESVEQSLRRLGRETVDILLLHGVGPDAYEAVIEQVYPVVARLRDQGKIRALGVSESANLDLTQEMLTRAVRDDLFDVIMARFNMFHQGARRRLFPDVQEKDIGLLCVCPVEPPLSQPAELKDWLASLQREGKVPAEALAGDDPVAAWIEQGTEALVTAGMRFAAHQPVPGAVVTGTASPDHLEQNVTAALKGPLETETEHRLHALYGTIEEGRVRMGQK